MSPRSPSLSLELDAWRAVGQGDGLEDVVARLAPLLLGEHGAAAGAVVLLDLARRRVAVAASFGALASSPAARTELEPDALERVLSWSAQRSVTRADRTPPQILPAGFDAAHVAVPLRVDDDPAGALVLAPRVARGIAGLDAAARALAAPLSAAIEHERRIHELSRLREAAEAENRALRTRLGRGDISASIVGAERGLAEVLERVEKVAATDAPVLILGETGSGKEVIARAIHERSTRASGPIVRVNCGAIAPELVDSELFGHEKGSFTGASGTHRGWFERADGGTLFLDEIGELPLPVQVRLLRVLQDGTFTRVGGQRSQSCDVRLVAATHRNLEEMVAQRSFRQDLWYRIGVFPIRLPSLRERPQDIPDLAAHFAASAGRRLGAGALAPTREDVELLLSYDWPGNVRELAAVIERAAILGDGKRLDVRGALGLAASRVLAAVPTSPVDPAPRSQPADTASANARATADSRTSGASQGPVDSAPFRTLSDAERAHVERALDATRGRIEGPHGAAALLGINPHTLRSRMRKLGIDWRSYRSPRVGPGTTAST